MFAPTDLLLKCAPAEVRIMLLGNKCDCDDARVVSTERGQMVSHLHILYLQRQRGGKEGNCPPKNV